MNDKAGDHRLPQYLYRPIQLLFFEADDVVAAGIGYLMGFFMGGWFWFAILVLPVVYGFAKKGRPRGFLKHMVWAIGWAPMSGYPGFFDGEFFE